MRRLLGVELLRVRSRRAVLLLLVITFVLPAIFLVGTAWNTRPVSAAELERAEQQAERESQRGYVQREIDNCVEKPRRYGVNGNASDVQAACEEQLMPRVEWFTTRSPLDLAEERRGSGFGVIVVVTLLLMLVGTTFAGHDWNSGSMSNQLLFEPRRVRVWLAKGAVVLLTGLAVAAVVLTSYWTGLWLIAESRDITTPQPVIDSIAGRVLRGTPLAAGAALGAYALTMFFRSTVATLGVLFVTAIVGPLLIAATSIGVRWTPQLNFIAVLNGGARYFDEEAAEECALTSRRCGFELVSTADGAVYLGVALLVAAAASIFAFRRRDVP
jgi:ABC-2 type transport system permease protein